MHAGGLAHFFEDFPALARLVATITDDWVDAATEFLTRLDADWDSLVRDLLDGDEPGPVTGLHCNLSDPHNGGRSTFLLTFGDGRRVIYKPRDLATELNWFALLAWLNAHGAPLPFATLPIVDRGAYGWVGFAAHRPCAEVAEARRFYTRTGMILALVYALGGNDCHFENIIASGEQPILVDLETIMHPIRREGGDAGALQRVIGRERFESVIRTGLLPQWIPQAGGRALDTSALGAVNETQTTRPQPAWRDINTDAMRLDRAHMAAPAGTNAASIAGVPISPNDYVAEIETGFRQMYELLIDQRDALLAPDGPLPAMRHQSLRFIFRGTGVYFAVTERANRPECLRDGADRSIELDALARAQLLEPERPAFWPLLGGEHATLDRGDIPHFLVAADSVDLLPATGEPVRGCFAEPCIDSMRDRLRRLNSHDLARQGGYIRATMQARVARHGTGEQIWDADDAPLDDIALPSPEALVEDAIAIADAIRRDALGDPPRGVAWMTVRYHFAMQRFQLEVSGPGLYDGGCGIALFLAALERVTGGAGFRDLALGAIAPLRDELRSDGQQRTGEVGIGGASGLGSFVYGLTHIGQLLDEPVVLDDAATAAALVTPARIADDRAFDVIGGSAGAILGLLALHAATGDEAALDRAVACGHHLLAHRTADAHGHRAWVTSANGRMPAGFAHGAAGIATALEAIAYETSLFSPLEGNWPDLRVPEPEYATSWCNGGPGVGLARLGGLAGLDTPAIGADIDAATNVILRAGTGGVDHLCCGNLGRADILLEMGQRLARPDLTHAARARIAALRHRAHERDGYRLWWKAGGGVSVPGLFQGTSGIGYALLRAAFPDRLPAVLLWA
jgi:type 2 lantibiotic biosynthesis protein LanM